MVVPLTPRGAEGGEAAPYGHAARLAARASRCSFLAAQPGHLTLVSARPAPSLPCHSRPSAAAGHGQIVYRGSEQEPNLPPCCHAGKETPENSQISFSAVSRITPCQRGVTKVKSSRSQKGFLFKNLFTYLLARAFPSAFSIALSPNPAAPRGFELLRL